MKWSQKRARAIAAHWLDGQPQDNIDNLSLDIQQALQEFAALVIRETGDNRPEYIRQTTAEADKDETNG